MVMKAKAITLLYLQMVNAAVRTLMGCFPGTRASYYYCNEKRKLNFAEKEGSVGNDVFTLCVNCRT
ncbi:hypothetical protein WN944_022849 [Citrus x changshan-huyou]|uniref:Secreted protein n=1 Tax=Citrus x changshan-huyou TaxID=2935761 RepID=A0AAP0N1G0_9ROSI